MTPEEAKRVILSWIASPEWRDMLQGYMTSPAGRAKLAYSVLGPARFRLEYNANILTTGCAWKAQEGKRGLGCYTEPMTPAMWLERVVTIKKDIVLYEAVVALAVAEGEQDTEPMQKLRNTINDFKSTRDACQARAV